MARAASGGTSELNCTRTPAALGDDPHLSDRSGLFDQAKSRVHQDAYGLEKLMAEEMLMHYDNDFGMQCRIGRFHNIYGPLGTWKGGREKAPASFCRKAISSSVEFEMWGNGLQTRSFCYIDDCVEGVLRLMVSDYKKPLNIGSDEKVSMNEMAGIVLDLKGTTVPIKHIPGPEGVRGRNSDNALIQQVHGPLHAHDASRLCPPPSNGGFAQVLGWAPSTSLRDGLGLTYSWIESQISEFLSNGGSMQQLTSSTVVTQTMTDTCDMSSKSTQ